MRKGKKRQNAKAELFKRMYGVKTGTFNKMLSILQKEFNELHKKGGKPPKLTSEDKLYIALKYLRHYPAMDYLAAEYGVCKGTIRLPVQWVEDTLVKDGTFSLREKRALKRTSTTVKRIVIDVTEIPINRPKEGEKGYYSGKKRHTLKTQ